MHTDIGEDDWGAVTVWEPGSRLVHTFTLAQDPGRGEFVHGDDTCCTMRFAHGGWTEANAGARQKFGDWRVMLDRFAALLDAQV